MTTMTPYRPPAPPGHDGFGQVLHAEWTKFRTVRGWIVGLIIAIILVAGLGALVAKTSGNASCSAQTSSGQQGPVQHGAACGGPGYALGPGGEPVNDSGYFVRQPLAGNGSLTVRVTSLTQALQRDLGPTQVAPWSKAGIIIRDSTAEGSAYAAMMATYGNGVRMQWNYTGDTPGLPGAVSSASPRWLRLTRDGDVITGYDSADGTHWAQVGSVTLSGLPSTVQAGLFVASPMITVYTATLGQGNGSGYDTVATAVFDHVNRTGTWPAGAWTGDNRNGAEGMSVGGANGAVIGGYSQVAGQFMVTGTGDIAPIVAGPAESDGGPAITLRDYLMGTFAGLIAVAVVATMFMSSEYRRGLIRTTLAASPHRGRVLAAKAIVIGLAAFVVGMVAAAGALIIGKDVGHLGSSLFPTPGPTELRMIVGTGAAVAVMAILTLAIATIVRRSATAILIVIVAIVIPYVLSVPPGIPAAVTGWLMRVTPAAGFAVQQAVPQYYQVQASYTTAQGFFPLSPWDGFAVLCAWTVLALALAAYLLRRRDA
jgi:ABC-type transport system involved in multi-copper enzyme maturation permease subunit/regulation of enolase protein 1 (concanavalin A-like superfamily)